MAVLSNLKWAAVLGCLMLAATQVDGQESPSRAARIGDPVAPGPHYRAGVFTRAVQGSGWRDVWTTPVDAPVLDLATYSGGLTLEKRGGGFHTLVLHLKEENGWQEHRFRSGDKFPEQGMPRELHGTLVGRLLHDQVVSVLFPAAPVIVPPLLEAVGVLHVVPRLYVMGDSPRLGVLRDTVAGLLGTMELKASEAPDDKPGFAGSRKITGTDKFQEALASSREHRLDEREFLAARLIDMLVNDPDRSADNYDWARFGDKGAYTWRPLPRDRDQAFINANGVVNAYVIRRFYPKQVEFRPEFDLKGLTYTTYVHDRKLLQRLTVEDFRDVALRVQRALDDGVIAEAVARLPREWREATTADERIASVLRSRRDHLPQLAMRFYRLLSGEVDIHGTAEPDRFEVMRHADGRVSVTVGDPGRPAIIVRRDNGVVETVAGGEVADRNDRGPWFFRTFLPGETNEIRLYADSGDDVAIVRGVPGGPIVVRVIGGKGNDTLTDSAGGDTFLYDAEGSNRLLTAPGTRVDTRPWKDQIEAVGFRWGGDWVPDWGGRRGWKPAFDYNTSAGLIVGGGPRFKSYGFRRLPYHWRAGANLLVGTGNGRVGLTVDADYRAENAPRAFRLEGQATQLASIRFFGYGNNTPALARELNVVEQTRYMLEPSVVRFVGWRSREGEGNAIRGDSVRRAGLRSLIGELRVGAVLGWVDPEPALGSPLASGVTGAQEFGLAGARLGFELERTDEDAVPTSGWNVEADVAAFPPLGGLDDAFGTAKARGAFYVPLGRRGGPHLAVRAGGALASGDFPAQFAPTVGGRSSLRGYSYRRFAGDRAVNGGAELRVPLGTVNFLIRSQVGAFALADAGRVWFDGKSEGGWHTGVGGGVWFSAFGRSVSLAYARGESPRFYVSSGMFY